MPCSEWTLAAQGSKQVEIRGLDDKREMTALLATTLGGKVLPPQLIYAGKTPRCHPSGISFPDDWNITHSGNHWSNEQTMLEFADKILIPYVKATKESLSLPSGVQAVALFDVFAAHRCSSFLTKLQDAGIKVCFIPAGCTGLLQPLDISVNDPFKQELKSSFSDWYAAKVSEYLRDHGDTTGLNVNLKTSIVKPLHANWLIHAISWLRLQEDKLLRGWRESGILEAVTRAGQAPTEAAASPV